MLCMSVSKSLSSYRDAIRELRAAGYDLPASAGYRLSGKLSAGIKSAITRAANHEARAEAARKGWKTRRANEAAKTRRPRREVAQPIEEPADSLAEPPALTTDFLEETFDDSAEWMEAWEESFDYADFDDLIDEYADVDIDDSETGGKGGGK